MPIERYQRITPEKKSQKSAKEKPNADEAVKRRVHDILNQEKNIGKKNIIREARQGLKKLLTEIKNKKPTQEKAQKEKRWETGSNWRYKGIGGKSVKNDEGTTSMRVFGPKFGNENGEIALGAMHTSERDRPWEDSQSSVGIGIIGSTKF